MSSNKEIFTAKMNSLANLIAEKAGTSSDKKSIDEMLDDVSSIGTTPSTPDESDSTDTSEISLDGKYAISSSEIDAGTGDYQVEVLPTVDDQPFSILTVKAPEDTPYEATLSLLASGTGSVYFADLSCMHYKNDDDTWEDPEVSLYAQSRGGYALPNINFGFNDGTANNRRTKKLVIMPNCRPIRLEANGIRVRTDNDGTDETFTESNSKLVNLAALSTLYKHTISVKDLDGTSYTLSFVNNVSTAYQYLTYALEAALSVGACNLSQIVSDGWYKTYTLEFLNINNQTFAFRQMANTSLELDQDYINASTYVDTVTQL